MILITCWFNPTNHPHVLKIEFLFFWPLQYVVCELWTLTFHFYKRKSHERHVFPHMVALPLISWSLSIYIYNFFFFIFMAPKIPLKYIYKNNSFFFPDLIIQSPCSLSCILLSKQLKTRGNRVNKWLSHFQKHGEKSLCFSPPIIFHTHITVNDLNDLIVSLILC